MYNINITYNVYNTFTVLINSDKQGEAQSIFMLRCATSVIHGKLENNATVCDNLTVIIGDHKLQMKDFTATSTSSQSITFSKMGKEFRRP